MIFINNIPLKKPLLKAYLGASHIVEEANIYKAFSGKCNIGFSMV